MDVEGGDLVAWLALALAAVTFGWQVLEARQRRRTRVDVEVQHAALPASIPDGPELLAIPVVGINDRTVVWPAEEPLTYVLVAVAANRGESREWLHDFQVRDIDRRVGAGANPGAPAVELPPRGGRWPWAFRIDHLSFDLSRGFYLEVTLGSKEITSGPHFLDDWLISTIDKHNAGLDEAARGS